MRTAQGCYAVFACAALRLSAVVLSVAVSQPSHFAFGQGTETVVPAAASEDASASATDVTADTVSSPLALHARIDALLADKDRLLVAPRARDGELLRRLSLDLRGVVPTRDELDAFAADPSPDRWQAWISRFLADPLSDEHLVNFLDRTLMLRRAHTQVDRASWINYLREQVANNTPLDQLSNQLLDAPWWNQENRAAQKFFLDRGGDPNLIARDLGRVFLGQDLQCAQCHDHPLVDDYKQTDYHGLVAFFAPSKLVEATYKDAEDKEQKVQLYIETPAGDAAFESVFNKGIPYRSGPRLPDATEQFEEYELPTERLLEAPPAGALGGVPTPPKHSRRQVLAEELASRTNRPFVSNWANRLWAMAFGRGLVHPVDMQHADNPPMHPELFVLISDGLVEVDMQPKRFVEQLVLTQAYQRGGMDAIQANASDALPLPPSAEQAAAIRARAEAERDALAADTELLSQVEKTTLESYEVALDAWSTIQAERAAIRTELDAAETSLVGEKKKADDAASVLAAAEKRNADSLSRITLLEEAAAKLQQAIGLSGAEDAELKQAVELSKQRAETVRGTIPEIDKAVVDAKAGVDATAPTLAQAIAKTEEVVDKLQPIQQSLLAADTATLAARREWIEANVALLDAKRRASHAEHTLAWLDSLKDIERAHSEQVQLALSLAEAEASVGPNADGIGAAQMQLKTIEDTLASKGEALATAKAAMEAHANAITQLQQSLEGLVQASSLVPSAETLAAAQATIRSELETRRTQTGQLQTDINAAQQVVDESSALVIRGKQELDSLQKEAEKLRERLAALREQQTLKQSELNAANNLSDERWAVVRNECTQQLDTTGLFALTPEQLCWSILRVTGQLDAYIQAERVELDKQSPLAEDADDATKAVRQRQAVRLAVDKLRGNADVFVSLYASGPDKTQDDFFASADQALFTANGGNVFAWAGPGNNNITQQAIAMTDPAQIAQGLYWTLLCRQPTAIETQLVAEQVASAGDDRNTVIQEMVWGILASTEFRFCH